MVEFLRRSDDESVVTSYSVCDQFPNRFVAEWEDDYDGDEWYELPSETRWEMAFSKIRDSDRGLELKPDNWDAFRFGHGLGAFGLIEHANKMNEGHGDD